MPSLEDLRTEEDVKIKFLLPYLRERGYEDVCFSFGEGIEIQEGRKRKTIYPDLVIYASPQKTAPLILCETKAPNEVLDKFAKGQAISYARLLPRIAPIALTTNGSQVQVFQTLNKNRIAALPTRGELQEDIVNFIVSRDVQDALRAEAKHGLFIIDDVTSFKNILKRCHNEIRNNEGYDPTVAFDEMSKVLFCKLYEEKEHADNNRFRVSIFDETLKRLNVNVVRQIFDETKTNPKYSGLFDADSKIQLQDRTIRTIVGLFENYDLSLTAFDVKGEAFEYFLSDTFTGGLGEYFTPRNIVEFIVDAIDPKIAEKIVDPFCGTGGFLIYAFDVVSEKIRLQEFSEDEKARWKVELSDRSLFGTDWKERTSQACKMNMMVHGDGSAGIFKHHGLTDVPDSIVESRFDLCLTNPPFGSFENDPEILKNYELGAGRNSQARVILAIERAVRLVKPEGWIGIVVIDGLLNNRSTRYVRDYLRKHVWIKGVISLATETFQGYGAAAKTSVLLLQKKRDPDEGEQRPVFMAVTTNTGYAPNGAPVAGNELPDILLDYKAFLRGDEISGRPRVLVANLEDRLDAEFYWKRSLTAEGAPLEDIQAGVSDLLKESLSEYEAITNELESVFREQEIQPVLLDTVLDEVRVRETLVPGREYRLIGVSGQGGGAFIREGKTAAEIKAKSLNKVSAGWIIYNRLFAFRGSFAVLTEEHEGCYVSGEFPTFVVKQGIQEPELVAKYIVHCLNSPNYLNLIDAHSTGSTKESRNRFDQSIFLSLKVQMPASKDGMRAIVELLDRADRFRAKQNTILDTIKEFRQGIARLLPTPNYDAEDFAKADVPKKPPLVAEPEPKGVPAPTEAERTLAAFSGIHPSPVEPRKKRGRPRKKRS